MVRVAVVSDVHGRAADLVTAGEGVDALLCLGDLIDFVDYDDPRGGILGRLFGPDQVSQFVALRTQRRFDEARAYSASLWESLGEPREVVIRRVVDEQYAELFGAFGKVAASGVPVYLTYGNVDLPQLFTDHATEGVTILDGQVVDIGGVTFGFVGGGLPTPMHTPMEIPEDVYAAKVDAVAGCDVLCSHLPPHVPMMVYDTRARRYERGSAAVLDAIGRWRPRYVLSGHVHNPLVPEMWFGATGVLNVGHFRARGTPTILDVSA
ncbi:MAG TPA: metallophosphoesterase [Mycobacteriales bacterium]|nr:metallophosphoesterase [Mycobacteriales bacterium]